jgi:nitrogen fixation protein NifB
MLNSQVNEKVSYNVKTFNAWFEGMSIPVAPACNMMCNFCSKDSDCVCNGNSPQYISKPMTPRQGVNFAINSTNKNHRIKILKICGPGEPLFNHQTFEVLRRLNNELPDFIYSISTNGLLLKEKAEELLKLNVKLVEVSINAAFNNSSEKLYSRILRGDKIISGFPMLSEDLLSAQIEGIRACVEKGIAVKVNSIYFPGINEKDLYFIAELINKIGVRAMCIISCIANGKLRGLRTPTMSELSAIQQEIAKILRDVEVKSFITSIGNQM